MGKRINYEEFKVASEIPIFFRLRLKDFLNKKVKTDGKILIVDTCIIGDFLATLPALSLFIKKNNLKVDIIVSPPLKELAEKIKGVEKVFTSKSSYKREIEKNVSNDGSLQKYEQIIILRISPEAYRLIKNIKYSKMLVYDLQFFKFAGHILKNIFLGKEIKQWRDVNFSILGLGKSGAKINFRDIFNFNEDDYRKVEKIPVLKGKDRKIIIHTGSGWKMKLWDGNNWVSLLKKINKLGNFRFIFIGSNNQEKETFEFIKKNVDFDIFSLINKINLLELFLVMRFSDYFIGVDSGPRNMAHLAELRSLVLLNPVALRDFMPWDKRDIVVDKPARVPISIFNFGAKSLTRTISVKEVFEAFRKLIKNS